MPQGRVQRPGYWNCNGRVILMGAIASLYPKGRALIYSTDKLLTKAKTFPIQSRKIIAMILPQFLQYSFELPSLKYNSQSDAKVCPIINQTIKKLMRGQKIRGGGYGVQINIPDLFRAQRQRDDLREFGYPASLIVTLSAALKDIFEGGPKHYSVNRKDAIYCHALQIYNTVRKNCLFNKLNVSAAVYGSQIFCDGGIVRNIDNPHQHCSMFVNCQKKNYQWNQIWRREEEEERWQYFKKQYVNPDFLPIFIAENNKLIEQFLENIRQKQSHSKLKEICQKYLKLLCQLKKNSNYRVITEYQYQYCLQNLKSQQEIYFIAPTGPDNSRLAVITKNSFFFQPLKKINFSKDLGVKFSRSKQRQQKKYGCNYIRIGQSLFNNSQSQTQQSEQTRATIDLKQEKEVDQNNNKT